MKSSGSMISGTLNPSAYGSYAHYLVKCIQAYATQGVPLYAITPQNEPLHAPSGYPGMLMSSTEEATFGSESIEDVAFSNLDGSKVLIVLNSASSSNTFTVRWSSKSFTSTLPAGAVATFTGAGTPSAQTARSP